MTGLGSCPRCGLDVRSLERDPGQRTYAVLPNGVPIVTVWPARWHARHVVAGLDCELDSDDARAMLQGAP